MFKYRKMLKALAAVCAVSAALPAVTGLTASAAEQEVLKGYYGDLDGNQAVNDFDITLMQYYLLIDQSPELLEIEYADLDRNGIINAVDLTLLKRIVLGEAEAEGIYETVEVPDPPEITTDPKELIAPAVAETDATLPSVGERKILMVAVDFPDCKFPKDYSADYIQNLAFGPENPQSSAYPLESVTAYYDRASYGRLHLTGDVYKYSAQKNSESYIQYDSQQGYLLSKGYASLLNEVLGALDSEIDYSDYDSDGDRVLDTVILALPPTASEDLYWPCTGSYAGDKKFDRIEPGKLGIGAWDLEDHAGFVSTWTHELGHAMGLPDYYLYENIPEGEDGEGLHGDAGSEMMDEAQGDMCALDKLMFGWYTENEVQIYTGGTQTFTIDSSQNAPSCLLIPRGDFNGYCSEYFLVESVLPDGNNSNGFHYSWAGTTFGPLFRKGGIRVLHCDTELYTYREDYWFTTYEYTMFKWEGFSEFYDQMNDKQRFVRLVNDYNGFFGAGDTINSATTGFAWYDESSGYENVNPNIQIQVESIEDGKAVVTVSPA